MEPFTTLDQFCVWPETSTIVHTPSDHKWTLTPTDGALVNGSYVPGLRDYNATHVLCLQLYDNSIPVLRLRLDGSMTITSAQLVQFILDVLAIEDGLIASGCQLGHIQSLDKTTSMSTNMQQVLELKQHPIVYASRLADAIINIMGCDRTSTRPERDDPTDPLLFRFFLPNNPERFNIARALVRNANNKDVCPGEGAVFIPFGAAGVIAPPQQSSSSSSSLPKAVRPLKRQRTKYNSDTGNGNSNIDTSGEDKVAATCAGALAVAGRRGGGGGGHSSRSTRGRGGRRGAHVVVVAAAPVTATADTTNVVVIPVDITNSTADTTTATVDLN
jgi:hypothetical protein